MSDRTKDLSRVFRALGNERRVLVLEILFNSKSKELTVSDLANKLGLSLKSTSKHLQQLESAGLVSRRQMVTSVFYKVNVSDKQLYFYLKNKLRK